MKIGVLGSTGLVGQEFLKIIEQKKLKFSEVRLFASDQSSGLKQSVFGQQLDVQFLSESGLIGLDACFFFLSDDLAKKWVPHALQKGCWVIDNSSAFRMDSDVPLVVPEIHKDLLSQFHKNRDNTSDTKPFSKLIANPNCSTIQLVMTLWPIHLAFGVTSVRVASYQSVSGAGKAGQDQLKTGTGNCFPHPIQNNHIPQIGSFDSDGRCTEENKIIQETQKIMNLPTLPISVTTVRVPTLNSHSEAVWITLKNQPSTAESLRSVLQNFEGVCVQDQTFENLYPLAQDCSGKDEVFVGRIRKDVAFENGWQMWIVADNLRKGAALNALQIFQALRL